MADTIDRSGGFGATEQKSDNSDQIRQLLDQVQELMIEDGTDPATAEALTNFARPATPAYAGNLADLNRMGQVVMQGRIDTPAGEPDEEASDLQAAFKEPPAPPLSGGGLQTPMAEIDAEGNPTGGTVGEGDGDGDGEPVGAGDGEEDGGEEEPDYQSMTKAELQAELDEQGIDYASSDTKAELIEKLNG